MAFAIIDGHIRQEGVYARISYDRDASTIRSLLTETHVAATDRRARFVGIQADTGAGGTVLRDLFTEDRGGYLEDVALLDLLVTARPGREVDALHAADGTLRECALANNSGGTVGSLRANLAGFACVGPPRRSPRLSNYSAVLIHIDEAGLPFFAIRRLFPNPVACAAQGATWMVRRALSQKAQGRRLG